MTPPLDLLTVGRVSVDLYGDEPGAGFGTVAHFVKSVGGTATNVAVAAARLGRRSAVFTKVGTDPFGDYVRAKLDGFGVDTAFVGRHPTLRTPLAFAVLDPPEDPPLLFYREPTAPDLTIEVGEIDMGVVADVAILWVTGTGFSAEPGAATTLALLQARSRQRHTVLDLDYRPMFWPSPADARRGIGAALAHVTVAVGNRAECEIAVGSADPETAAARLLDAGVEVAIVKQGAGGTLVATAAGTATVPSPAVDVLCGLGAGDAFGGALCHALLAAQRETPAARP